MEAAPAGLLPEKVSDITFSLHACVLRHMASSGGTKLGPKQQEAIEGLLRPGSGEDVAREIGVTTKKLSGWMKNLVFMAAYRAAIRAEHRHCSGVSGAGTDH